MDPQSLAQLKDQRDVLKVLLQQQRENPEQQVSPGIRMTVEIYMQILEDAVATVNSLIQHLETRGGQL